MVEFKSTHFKSHISDTKKKKSLWLNGTEPNSGSIYHVKEHGPLEQGGEVLLERQTQKGRGEENRNRAISAETANLKFGGHLVYPLPESQESLLSSPFRI